MPEDDRTEAQSRTSSQQSDESMDAAAVGSRPESAERDSESEATLEVGGSE